jgi:hypothetical protein
VNVEQYKIVSARRQGLNVMMWQTPALAVAAQGFLLATSLRDDTSHSVALMLSVFSTFVGIASAQLMAKHRHHEVADSLLLEEFELAHSAEGFAVIHGRPHSNVRKAASWFMKLPSFRLWMGMLIGFCCLDVVSAGIAVAKIAWALRLI